MRLPLRHGYTLIETIVALLLFSVGGLALSSTAAVIGRQLSVDGARQRAALVATSRLEILRATCGTTSGGDTLSGVRSEWSAAPAGAFAVALTERVTYATWTGTRTDTYNALVPCR